jgi:uncharacterized integral membrane protein
MFDRIRTLRFRIQRGLTVLGLLLFIVFLLQNTGEIHVRFLFFDGNIPSVILILVTSLGGFAAGYFTALNANRRWRKRQAGKEKEPIKPTPEEKEA